MTHGKNEFPVRLDLKAILDIKNKGMETEHLMYVLKQVGIQEIPQVQFAAQVLIGLQEYLKERHVDPGFQVVLGE